MRKLADYLELAKTRTGATSDRKLAALIGIGATTLFHLQRGRHWPSDELMTKLAMLAGIDPQIALLDLCIWRAGENTLARSTYIQIARRLGKSAAALFLAGCFGAATALMIPTPARAAANFAEGTERAQVRIADQANVYYGKRRRAFFAYLGRRCALVQPLRIPLIAQLLCRAVMRLSHGLMRGVSPAVYSVMPANSCAVHYPNAFLPPLLKSLQISRPGISPCLTVPASAA